MMLKFIGDYNFYITKNENFIYTSEIQDSMEEYKEEINYVETRIERIKKTLVHVPRYAWTKLPLGHLHGIDDCIKSFVEDCKQQFLDVLDLLGKQDKKDQFLSKFKEELKRLEIEQRAVLAELSQELKEKEEEEKNQRER